MKNKLFLLSNSVSFFSRLKKAVTRHGCFFAVFFVLLFYSFVVVGQCNKWTVDSAVEALYALDFSFGFSSRILPGAIYMFFFRHVDSSTLEIYLCFLMILFFAVLAVYAEILLKNCRTSKERTVCCFLLFLFLTGPFTFSVYVLGLGINEVYLLFCTAIFFLFLEHRSLQVLIIPLCLITLLFNYASIICYIPLYCVLLLYKISVSPKRKEKTLLCSVFTLSVLASVALFVYFTTSLELKIPLEEFERIIAERGGTDPEYAAVYFFADFHMNQSFFPDAFNSPFLEKLGEKFPVIWYFLLPFSYVLNDDFSIFYYFDLIILLFPILFFISVFFFRLLKDKSINKTKRFVYLCIPLLFFVTVISSLFISIDRLKWLTCAYIPLLSSVLYLFHNDEKNMITDYLSRIIFSKSGTISPFTFAYCAVYAFTIYSQYH